MGEVSYKGHRYPAEIIAHCVWLYHRFPLSFRKGTVNLSSPRAIFRRFASAIHQVACDV